MDLVGPLTLTNINRAPELPGLYVWYARLIVGEADLVSSASLTSLLDAFSARFERQPMQVNATLNFDLGWKGSIEATTDRSMRKPLETEDERVVRGLVAELLRSAQHVFFQPLYIGKAQVSLRQRLRQHVDELTRLKALEAGSGLELQGTDDFAQRAAALRFSEDQLVCFALPVAVGPGLSSDHAARAISLAESYLNSWAVPILGRK